MLEEYFNVRFKRPDGDDGPALEVRRAVVCHDAPIDTDSIHPRSLVTMPCCLRSLSDCRSF